jgi:hypothetical protein
LGQDRFSRSALVLACGWRALDSHIPAGTVLGQGSDPHSIVLHIPIFFNGLVPFFGRWLSGLQGIVVLTNLIMVLLCLAWGILNRWAWAWWGSLVYFGLLTASSVLTLVRSSYLGLLVKMNFPPAEVEFLDGVPLQGWHLAAFVGLPLVLTVVAILVSKRSFTSVDGERVLADAV